MDSKFQSSFIPKDQVGEQNFGQRFNKEKTSLMGKLASIIFVLTILGMGGLFGYKMVIENSIESLQVELANVEASIDKEAIQRLSDFNKKLIAAKNMVNKHVATSEYLSFLETNTLTGASYSSLTYSAPDVNGVITASMVGSAPSYSALAQEENILLSNPNVVSVKFNNLKLGTTGNVEFSLILELKGDLIKWSSNINSINSNL